MLAIFDNVLNLLKEEVEMPWEETDQHEETEEKDETVTKYNNVPKQLKGKKNDTINYWFHWKCSETECMFLIIICKVLQRSVNVNSKIMVYDSIGITLQF